MPPPHRPVSPQGDRQTDSPARSGRKTSGRDPRPPTSEKTGEAGAAPRSAALLFLASAGTSAGALPPGRVRWRGGGRLGEVFLRFA